MGIFFPLFKNHTYRQGAPEAIILCPAAAQATAGPAAFYTKIQLSLTPEI
jgi:hypothetical protein